MVHVLTAVNQLLLTLYIFEAVIMSQTIREVVF